MLAAAKINEYNSYGRNICRCRALWNYTFNNLLILIITGTGTLLFFSICRLQNSNIMEFRPLPFTAHVLKKEIIMITSSAIGTTAKKVLAKEQTVNSQLTTLHIYMDMWLCMDTKYHKNPFNLKFNKFRYLTWRFHAAIYIFLSSFDAWTYIVAYRHWILYCWFPRWITLPIWICLGILFAQRASNEIKYGNWHSNHRHPTHNNINRCFRCDWRWAQLIQASVMLYGVLHTMHISCHEKYLK